MMTYRQFKAAVRQGAWTLAQLRGDVPMGKMTLDLIDRVGIDYERFVLRLGRERERAGN